VGLEVGGVRDLEAKVRGRGRLPKEGLAPKPAQGEEERAQMGLEKALGDGVGVLWDASAVDLLDDLFELRAVRADEEPQQAEGQTAAVLNREAFRCPDEGRRFAHR
jgi:hypothetical protein